MNNKSEKMSPLMMAALDVASSAVAVCKVFDVHPVHAMLIAAVTSAKRIGMTRAEIGTWTNLAWNSVPSPEEHPPKETP